MENELNKGIIGLSTLLATDRFAVNCRYSLFFKIYLNAEG